MLIALEGLDGSGKSTVWQALHDDYPDAVFTAEPTDSWYGDAVRRSIDDPEADPLAELFLYCADHAAHLEEVIEPALEQDRLVICDRYVDSRIAYQGATLASVLDEPLAYVQAIHEPVTIYPALTIFVDVDLDTAIERSGEETKFERREMLRTVRANYRDLIDAAPERFAVIDGEQPPDAVHEAVRAAIDARR